jgi:uncharacterized protein YcnI
LQEGEEGVIFEKCFETKGDEIYDGSGDVRWFGGAGNDSDEHRYNLPVDFNFCVVDVVCEIDDVLL